MKDCLGLRWPFAFVVLALALVAVSGAQESGEEKSSTAEEQAAEQRSSARNRSDLEEVVVVGSRLPRDVSDAPSPTTTISALDIELSGVESVADLLRQNTYNSRGSYRERSGGSFGQIALVNLRGLGPSRTAVLIDGRRVPGTPFTGTSAVDLNTFPLASIERIEILTDSASAIYGADALGGVINVVMKDDFQGLELEFGTEVPTRVGADSEHLNALWGTTFDGGNLLVGFENYVRDPIEASARDYSKADFTPGSLLADTTGISAGGNTGFSPSYPAGTAFIIGDCDPDIYAGNFRNPFDLPGEACGFAYADIFYLTGQLERDTMFSKFNYQIRDNTRLYADIRLTASSTAGRYAPTVGFFAVNVVTDADGNPIKDADGNEIEPSHPDINQGLPFDALHRFVGHGNRDDTVELDETTLVVGLAGELPNSISYDFFLQTFEYAATELGNTYVSQEAIEREVAAGRYILDDPLSQDPVHLKAVADSGIQLSRDLLTDHFGLYVLFDGRAFEAGGGTALWAAGAETASEDFRDRYDSWRDDGDALGSAGNSVAGDRDKTAVFAELAIPLRDNWDLVLAGRYDTYSDFGSAFSPQLASRYRITESVAFRASVGEGFKAPNLAQLYSSNSLSFPFVKDTYRCELQQQAMKGPWNPKKIDDRGTEDRADDVLVDKTPEELADAACGNFQIYAYVSGNENLKAEQSSNLNLGIVLDVGIFSGSLDYYEVNLEDAVAIPAYNSLVGLEQQNLLPPAVTIVRESAKDDTATPLIDEEDYDGFAGDPGAISEIFNAYSNIASIDTAGLDFKGNFRFEDGFARYDIGVQWSHYLEYYSRSNSGEAPTQNSVGGSNSQEGFPSDRINVNFRMAFGDWTLSYNMNYIASFSAPEGDDEFPAWVGHDLTANWQRAFGMDALTLTAGILNFTDEDPSLRPGRGTYETSEDIITRLYPLSGSIPFLTLKYRYGG